jgi:hypothetical protein
MWSAPPMSRRCGWRRKTGPLADRSWSWEVPSHLEGDRMFPCTAQAVVGTGQVRSVSFGSAVPVPLEAVGNVRLPRLSVFVSSGVFLPLNPGHVWPGISCAVRLPGGRVELRFLFALS